MARKTHTSSEVKERWKAKTYKRYTVNLRKEEDRDLIQWVEEHREAVGVSEIFRAGVETLKNEG